jgi:hypothetical protein
MGCKTEFITAKPEELSVCGGEWSHAEYRFPRKGEAFVHENRLRGVKVANFTYTEERKWVLVPKVTVVPYSDERQMQRLVGITVLLKDHCGSHASYLILNYCGGLFRVQTGDNTGRFTPEQMLEKYTRLGGEPFGMITSVD